MTERGVHSPLPDVLGGGLPAALLDFSRGGFNLGRDISDLHALYRDERAPAVLFYCGRILETLLAAASELYFGAATTSAGPNLRRLADLGVLRGARLDQLEALRHLALDAIWTRRPLHWADASCAVLLLERLLLWFFVELERGPRLPVLGTDAKTQSLRDVELAHVLLALDAPSGEWKTLPTRSQSAFLRTPTLPALYLQRAIREGEHGNSAAVGVAEDAIRSFGFDVRLHQIHARLVRTRRAASYVIGELEVLNRRHPNDSETLRLLADAYHDVWQQAATGEREVPLRKALRAYQEAWSCSYETDNYSGMQAALLGLIRGRAQRAELVANTIFESYLRRFKALGTAFRFADFEDHVRLAHCALLLGDTEFARRRYVVAFDRPDATRALVDAAKTQIRAMLSALELPSTPGRFLSGKTSKRRRSNALQLELPLQGVPSA